MGIWKEAALALNFASLLAASHATAASLVPFGQLPDLSGQRTEVTGLSAAGDRAVGWVSSESFHPRAVLREGEGALRDLGTFLDQDGPPAVVGAAQAWGISADGRTVVGTSSGVGPGANTQGLGFRWTEDGGLESLGVPFCCNDSFKALATSDDGHRVVGGFSLAGNPLNIIYREGAGAEPMGELYGEGLGWAREITPDGGLVVGRSHPTAGQHWQAYRWTEDLGFEHLGVLQNGDHPEDQLASDAFATTPDGSVLVGTTGHVFSTSAMRWTREGGMQLLPPGPHDILRGRATDVDRTGRTIVGDGTIRTRGADGSYAFEDAVLVWRDGEIHVLRVLLESMGVDLAGWQLEEAVAVSWDGLTIAGNGTDPYGVRQGWIAVIPEPSTALLVSLGLCGLARTREVRWPSGADAYSRSS